MARIITAWMRQTDTIWGSFQWIAGKAQMEQEIRFRLKHGNLLIG